MNEFVKKKKVLDSIVGEPPELHYPSWYSQTIEDLPVDLSIDLLDDGTLFVKLPDDIDIKWIDRVILLNSANSIWCSTYYASDFVDDGK